MGSSSSVKTILFKPFGQIKRLCISEARLKDTQEFKKIPDWLRFRPWLRHDRPGPISVSDNDGSGPVPSPWGSKHHPGLVVVIGEAHPRLSVDPAVSESVGVTSPPEKGVVDVTRAEGGDRLGILSRPQLDTKPEHHVVRLVETAARFPLLDTSLFETGVTRPDLKSNCKGICGQVYRHDI